MKRSILLILLTTVAMIPFAGAQTTRYDSPRISRAGFGTAVAARNGSVFVGEPANTMTPGIVYVYDRNNAGEWIESARLKAANSPAGDGFGAALAAEGSSLIVSAVGPTGGPGTVFTFEKQTDGEWLQTGVLTAPDPMDEDVFGAALTIKDGTLLIGAPGRNANSGAVFAFEQNAAGAWDYRGTLVAEGTAEDDLFGLSLAMVGGTAFVGAPGRRNREGVVYAFESESGEWKEGVTLSAFGLERGSQFGSSLVAEGDRLLIGAPRHQRSTGAVYTYALDEGDWNQTGTLVAFDAAPNTRFGSTVNFVNGAVWVGAPGVNRFAGAIYSIEMDEANGWSSAHKLAASDGVRRTQFGTAVAVSADVAVVGRSGADGGSGAALIYEFVSGEWIETVSVQGAAEGLESITGDQVDCTDGKANQFDCESVDLVSFLSVNDLGGGRGVDLNDIWGWTDPVTGKEWALVGRTDGTSFVDVSNPSYPLYVGELMLTDGARPAAWRDIKVYKDHAYIVADGAANHGMQVFDLTRLRSVDNAPEVFSADYLYTGIASAHNIVINEDTGFAYAVGVNGGGETCGGGLHMINIQEPKNPIFAGCFSDTDTGRSGTGYSHDAMCVVYHGPDAEHTGKEICFGANETALSIADVTDKSNTVALSNASYPNVSYAHQGWITEDHRYFYLDDELDELQGRVPSTRTMIWDITDLDDPELVKEHQSPVKASDHNLYVRGNFMYQSNYVAGLRVLDITDPTNPVEVGYFDTVPVGENVPGFSGSWSNYPYFESGIIVVTSISEGLFVVKRRDIDI